MTNNKNAGYKVNFTTKTLTITKAFEEDLMNGDANAMAVVTRFQSMFPDLTIVRKTHRSPKATNPDKGLTYERMERYISLHENSGELLEMFQKVKAIASTQKNSFLMWRIGANLTSIRLLRTSLYPRFCLRIEAI